MDLEFYHPIPENIRKRISSNKLLLRVSAGRLICGIFLIFTGCAIHPTPAEETLQNPSPASQIVRFYQGPLDHLSAVRYGECPMHPSCSEYAISAIEKHGALIGWMMTFDRLIRCGMDETHLSSEAIVDGHWKYIDTLGQNDFWWYPASKNKALNPKSPEDVDWGISVE